VHAWAYVTVFLAAALEGEVVFIAASIAVATGRLNYYGVLIAGALGGSAGDQFFFYAFRGPLRHWLDRIPALHRRGEAIAARVRSRSIALAASCRFLPGLRIAIPIACGTAGVSPIVFTPLSMLTSFIWAAAILTIVGRAGPAAFDALGLARKGGLVVSAIVVLLVFAALRRITFESPNPKG
jgi:membrane protein DedA with SNARE-associated domain